MTAIVTPNTDTFTNPTMVSLLRYLQSKGETVVMFGPQQYPQMPEEFADIRFEPTHFKLSFRNPKAWKKQILSYCKVKRCLGDGSGCTLMTVDPLGLVTGGRIKRWLCPKVKLSYLSFEIFFKDELKGHYLKMKEKEIFYSRYIDSLLTQDETRRRPWCSRTACCRLSP